MAERVSFASSTGPALAGLIDAPSGPIRGWGLYAHGFTLGKDCPAAARICKQLAADGIAMLRFDNLGLGDSEGDWGDGSFTVKVADTRRALAFLAERGTPADLIVGHSWGGAAAIVTASLEPTVRAVVTVGAPSDPSTVEHQYDAVVDRAVSDGHARWLVGGKALTLKRTFVEDVRSAHLLDVVPQLRRPLLVMHSPTDDTVDISNAGDIFTAARHPRSFVSLEGSDHLLTAHGQAARAARIIGAWAEPYLTGAGA
ncbi:MAG TPA: alpha/beta fold hydrolase [Nocardioides sp.]|nr:alpha/beta fold hydrolase [Nocardioides sp.]